eukprot:COSAG02_NODE_1255_length_13582_cov_43.693095_8_plen_165_part_00
MWSHLGGSGSWSGGPCISTTIIFTVSHPATLPAGRMRHQNHQSNHAKKYRVSAECDAIMQVKIGMYSGFACTVMSDGETNTGFTIESATIDQASRKESRKILTGWSQKHRLPTRFCLAFLVHCKMLQAIHIFFAVALRIHSYMRDRYIHACIQSCKNSSCLLSA